MALRVEKYIAYPLVTTVSFWASVVMLIQDENFYFWLCISFVLYGIYKSINYYDKVNLSLDDLKNNIIRIHIGFLPVIIIILLLSYFR